MKTKEKISLIIPTYNEEKYIKNCINSLLETNYPREDLEIIIVDGNSSDKTVAIVKDLMKNFTMIKLINNPKKIAPIAMNLGIKASEGEYILRIDAHARYAPNYIEKCIELLERTNAVNVGGCMNTEPSNKGILAKSIALVLSHKFGVGNSDFRTVKEEKEVDTVPFGAFPRYIFDQVGMYNEILVRNQDIELNSRIIQSGGKIILSPEIQCTYFARGNYQGLWKQNYENGKWNIFTSSITANSLSLRHFIPFIFVSCLILSIILSLLLPKIGLLLGGGILGSYLLATLLVTLKVVNKTKQIGYFLFLPLSFFILHFSYGLGSITGVINLPKFKRKIRKEQKV